MQIHIVSLFPQMFQALEYGIVGRALEKKLLQLQHWNPRDYAPGPHQQVDDRPYGGGPGMVMQVAPLRDAIHAAKASSDAPLKVHYLSPQGTPLTQAHISELAQQPQMILLAGRYEGIDQRLIDQEVDHSWSVGDYVVSGGELPAMLLIDAMTRLLPDALGDPESAQQDSFSQGWLDHPHYTRPATIDDQSVPAVLQSGDHQAIAEWRHQQSLKNTWQKRPDLVKRRVLSEKDQALLADIIRKHEE